LCERDCVCLDRKKVASFLILYSLMATASATEIRSMTELPSQDNNNASNETTTDDEIDSALQAALRDPRERVALLRLETVFCDFMESDAGWVEVGGPFNSVVVSPVPSLSKPRQQQADGRQTSFQRCILHRLADRFGIVRENGSLLENSIRLIKMPDSCIPKVLLQNVEVAPENEKPEGSTAALPGKMKIMKRSDSRKSTDSRSSTGSSRKKNNNNGKKSSLSDKEKAYAEARARIFSDTEDSNNNNSFEAAAAVAEQSNALSSSSQKAPTFSQSSRTQSSDSIGSDKKAVYRNRAEEAADPDFQRGAAAVVFQQPYYAATYPVPGAHPSTTAPITGGTAAPIMPVVAPSTQYFVPPTSAAMAYPQQQQSLQAEAPAFTPRQRVYSSDDVPRQRVYSDDPMRLPTETRK